MQNLSRETQQLWFKRKTYGWGWTPVTFQGWIVTGVYIGIVVFCASSIEVGASFAENAVIFGIPVAIASLVLIAICYWKGEKPRWQWGK